MTDEPRILWLVAEQDGQLVGPVLWRVLFPHGQLSRRGFTAEWERQPQTDLDLSLVAAAVNVYGINTVILPRAYWPNPLDGRVLIDRLHDAGICVLGEYDDDMFLHLEDVKRGDDWALNEVEVYREQRVAALRMLDGALVSTPALATVVRSLTDKPVAVCPNYIDLDWWHRAKRGGVRVVPRGATTIGWSGGKRPVDDLVPMLEAWGCIARRFPAVDFVIAGWCPDLAREVVPRGRLHELAWLPLERFPQAYVNIDIACCAVAPGLFNRCKSPIKALEAAASGCAVVATPELYRDVVKHGDTGWLARTADEWEHALAMLVESPSWRKAMARRLLRHVEDHWSYNDEGKVFRWLDAVAHVRRHFVLRQGVAA